VILCGIIVWVLDMLLYCGCYCEKCYCIDYWYCAWYCEDVCITMDSIIVIDYCVHGPWVITMTCVDSIGHCDVWIIGQLLLCWLLLLTIINYYYCGITMMIDYGPYWDEYY